MPSIRSQVNSKVEAEHLLTFPKNFETSSRLQTLYFLINLLTFFGFIFCFLVARIFFKYKINHPNFAIIKSHLLLCLGLNNFFQLLKNIGFIFGVFIETNYDSIVSSYPLCKYVYVKLKLRNLAAVSEVPP